MTPVSGRFLPPLAGLLLLALAPVAGHRLLEPRVEACADPTGLLDTGRIPDARPDAERPEKYLYAIFQWSEGLVPGRGPELPMRYYVIRGDDPWNLYRDPTRFVRMKFDPDRSRWRRIDAGGTRLPLRVDHGHSGDGVRVVSGLFVYDGEPVASLFRTQLGSALVQLLTGTRPLTLYLVSGMVPPQAVERLEHRQARWLAGAWRAHRETCAP